MARRGDLRRGADYLDVARIGPVGAVQQTHQLGAPGTQKSGDADDLTVEHVEVGRLEHAAPAHPRRLEDRRSSAVDSAGRGRGDGLEVIELPTDHLGHQLLAWKVPYEVLTHEFAVAKNRYAVGDLVDLIEEMAHKDYGRTPGSQIANHGEELLDFAAIQAGCRLVENQDFGVQDHPRLIATSCWIAIE